MPASLSIQISAQENTKLEQINFFKVEEWTVESEQELVVKIHDILSVVRSIGKSFSVQIDLDVDNFDEAIFLIRKKTNKVVEINHHKLSIREIEVLSLIMQGYTNHDIAEKLFISYETVRSHRKNILEKTGAKNTAALIHHYHQTFFEK